LFPFTYYTDFNTANNKRRSFNDFNTTLIFMKWQLIVMKGRGNARHILCVPCITGLNSENRFCFQIRLFIYLYCCSFRILISVRQTADASRWAKRTRRATATASLDKRARRLVWLILFDRLCDSVKTIATDNYYNK